MKVIPAAEVYWVGGCVRDRLMGFLHFHDLDIAVDDNAAEVARILMDASPEFLDFVEFPKFRTAKITYLGHTLEIAEFRSESYDENSRKPETRRGSLESDAFRRDFTVNALYENVKSGELKDPTGRGLEDLKNQILRTPLDPEKTFFDDPLRIVRAIRFKHQLGFDFAPHIEVAIAHQMHRISILSKERLGEEFDKITKLENCWAAIDELHTSKIFSVAWPRTEKAINWEILSKDNSCDVLIQLFFATDLNQKEIKETLMHEFRASERDAVEISSTVELARVLLKSNLLVHEVRQILMDYPLIWSRAIALARLATNVETQAKLHLDRNAQSLILENKTDWRSPLKGADILQIAKCEPGPRVGMILKALQQAIFRGDVAPANRVLAEDFVRQVIRNESNQDGV